MDMSKMELKQYICTIRSRYKQSSKKHKSHILNEFCTNHGFSRKHAIKLLNESRDKPKTKKRGPKRTYNPDELLPPLKEIWLATGQLCGKLLKPAISIWLPSYEQQFGELEPKLRHMLLKVSAATIDRLLEPVRLTTPTKGLSGTKPGSLLKNQIPIKTNQWDESQIGFVEADTVAHCGSSLKGDFIWSLTLTDIYSGWTENRAVWNKGATGVLEQIKSIETVLPFELKGFDCDNGSEFLNHHLLRYFQDEKKAKPVQFTRSRPYHSQDNAHVEQKNWSHVRQLLGYQRFDNPKLVELVNDIYKNEASLINNFFKPAFKLKDKIRNGAKTKKIYDKPMTPYQRLIESGQLSQQQVEKLQAQFLQLNPFELNKSMKMKLDQIFNLLLGSSITRQRR